jgi:hypothetical protein
MFGWLKEKAAGSFLKSDAEKVLRNLVALPADIQRRCAHAVLQEILTALKEMESASGAGANRDTVIKKQLERAKANRHLAIINGARDYNNPDWAAAALCESWLMANTGALGHSTFDAINGLIMGWLHSTLTKAEIEEAERNVLGSLKEKSGKKKKQKDTY